MHDSKIFEKKSINQLILIFSIPTMCSLILESLTSMVDTIFAGHLGKDATDALSAMGLLSPVLLILISAQLIFGVSTSIVISKSLGENNKQKVNNTFKVGFYASIISSSAISIAIFIFKDSLLRILGAEGNTLILAEEFLNIALIFNVFSSVGYMLLNNIRAFGFPKIEILVGVSSTIINILLNIVFVFVFKLGIKGIAFSTLISEIFYFTFSLIFLIKKELWFKNTSLSFIEIQKLLKALINIGFVQFLMQGLNCISGFIINKSLIYYGGLNYIAPWTISSNVNMVILLPLIGLTQGVQSVVAYFHGKNDKKRKAEIKSKVYKYSLFYSVAIAIVVFLFSKYIVTIFTTDLNIIELSIPILKIIVVSFPFLGIVYTLITFMQVAEQGDKASILELIRQLCFLIPLSIILPYIFTRIEKPIVSPELSIFLSIPISSILLLIISLKYLKEHK